MTEALAPFASTADLSEPAPPRRGELDAPNIRPARRAAAVAGCLALVGLAALGGYTTGHRAAERDDLARSSIYVWTDAIDGTAVGYTILAGASPGGEILADLQLITTGGVAVTVQSLRIGGAEVRLPGPVTVRPDQVVTAANARIRLDCAGDDAPDADVPAVRERRGDATVTTEAGQRRTIPVRGVGLVVPHLTRAVACA